MLQLHLHSQEHPTRTLFDQYHVVPTLANMTGCLHAHRTTPQAWDLAMNSARGSPETSRIHATQSVPCPHGNSPAGPPPAPHTLQMAPRLLMLHLSTIACFFQKSISCTLPRCVLPNQKLPRHLSASTLAVGRFDFQTCTCTTTSSSAQFLSTNEIMYSNMRSVVASESSR
jgi:hypothetical protein